MKSNELKWAWVEDLAIVDSKKIDKEKEKDPEEI